MNFLCKMVGGSHAYGLNTATSDTDYRGVFVNPDIGHILGLGKERLEAKIEKSPEENTEGAFFELRHYLNLLRKTNTMVLEILFNEDWLEKSPAFDLILQNKYELLDSERFYKSLRGYMQNEARLAFGERTGTLGSQRKAALDKYGFSPKNIVNLLRLCHAGGTFFRTGDFPVKVENSPLRVYLLDIKTHPEKFSIKDLREMISDREMFLEQSYTDKESVYVFNENVANDICRQIYAPYINGANLEATRKSMLTYVN